MAKHLSFSGYIAEHFCYSDIPPRAPSPPPKTTGHLPFPLTGNRTGERISSHTVLFLPFRALCPPLQVDPPPSTEPLLRASRQTPGVEKKITFPNVLAFFSLLSCYFLSPTDSSVPFSPLPRALISMEELRATGVFFPLKGGL